MISSRQASDGLESLEEINCLQCTYRFDLWCLIRELSNNTQCSSYHLSAAPTSVHHVYLHWLRCSYAPVSGHACCPWPAAVENRVWLGAKRWISSGPQHRLLFGWFVAYNRVIMNANLSLAIMRTAYKEVETLWRKNQTNTTRDYCKNWVLYVSFDNCI